MSIVSKYKTTKVHPIKKESTSKIKPTLLSSLIHTKQIKAQHQRWNTIQNEIEQVKKHNQTSALKVEKIRKNNDTPGMYIQHTKSF